MKESDAKIVTSSQQQASARSFLVAANISSAERIKPEPAGTSTAVNGQCGIKVPREDGAIFEKESIASRRNSEVRSYFLLMVLSIKFIYRLRAPMHLNKNLLLKHR